MQRRTASRLASAALGTLELGTLALGILALGILALGILALTAGCEVDTPPEPLPAVSRQSFECAIQPIFLRQCSMPAGHGNPARRMKVLAPGRMRLPAEFSAALAQQSLADRESGYHPPLTQLETDFNYVQARRMIVPGQPAGDCALLSRPPAVSAGGLYHVEGGDVFTSAVDADYLTISAWVQSLGRARPSTRASTPSACAT